MNIRDIIRTSACFGFLVLLVGIGPVACREDAQQPSATQSPAAAYSIHTVRVQKSTNELSFPTKIQPLQVVVVTAPFEGTVEKIFFTYGQYVKKDQLLFQIKSEELSKQYRKNVTDYLKAKNAYLMAQNKFQGSKQLYQAKLINRNEFETEESALHNNYFGYINQEQLLRRFLTPLPRTVQFDYRRLYLKDVESVRKILERSISFIHVRAPSDGTAMFPEGDKTGKKAIQEGVSVKQGSALCMIGSLRDMALSFLIPESQINLIHAGAPVTITSRVAPGILLHGRVDTVSAQATEESGSSHFSARAIVHNASKAALDRLRIGVSATVHLSLGQQSTLSVPLDAVQIRSGKKQVQREDGRWQTVATAATSLRSVTVTQGLSAGDRIRVPKT